MLALELAPDPVIELATLLGVEPLLAVAPVCALPPVFALELWLLAEPLLGAAELVSFELLPFELTPPPDPVPVWSPGLVLSVLLDPVPPFEEQPVQTRSTLMPNNLRANMCQSPFRSVAWKLLHCRDGTAVSQTI